ncbi:hypothetical protein DBA29_27745, partial [Xenophilus aerolatus]|nr:hypothetical protein [Xenophilus aerolatus]
DASGAASTGVLTVRIVDDAPQAQPDVNSVTEDAAQNTATGNVLTLGAGADRVGADGAAIGGPVTAVSFGSSTGTVGSVLTTAYGQVVLNADGSYTYTLDNDNPAVNALKDGDTLTEVVNYTITDADGDASSATLTITINGRTDAGAGPEIAAVDGNGSAAGDAEVYERGLVDGPAGPDGSETTTASVSINTPDGLRSISVGGTVVSLAQLQSLGTTPVVVDTPAGTLTLIGFTPASTVGGVPTAGTLRYTYTLDGAQSQPGVSETLEVLALTVTDAGGAVGSGTLTVRIVDDAPLAVNDTAEITEDAMPAEVGGNLRTNDMLGADQANAVPVVSVDVAGVAVAPGSVIALNYGTLIVQADGSYVYRLDNANPAVQRLVVGETLIESVGYTLVDADGDASSATLTITVRGSNDGVTLDLTDGNGIDAQGQASVRESGLSTGDGSNMTGGTLVVRAPDGLASIEVAGVVLDPSRLQTLAQAPLSITTDRGILTLTGFDSATGTLSYGYVLTSPQDHRSGTTDDFTVVVRDRDGDATRGVLQVLVIDDAPRALDDAASVGTASPDPTVVSGNVLGAAGAGRGDNADWLGSDVTANPVTGIAFRGSAGVVGGPALSGQYGSLAIRADGSYTYTVNTNNSSVLALGSGQTLTEVFDYTITDADGSTSTARLTITIRGATQWNPPTVDPVLPSDLGDRPRLIGQGMDPAVFVQIAVRESRELSQLVSAGIASRVAGGPDAAYAQPTPADLDGGSPGPTLAEHVGRDGVAFSRALVRDIGQQLAQRGLLSSMPADGWGAFGGEAQSGGKTSESVPPTSTAASGQDAALTKASVRIAVPIAEAAPADPLLQPAGPSADGLSLIHVPNEPGDGAPSFSQRLQQQASERGNAQDLARAPVRIRVPATPQI